MSIEINLMNNSSPLKEFEKNKEYLRRLRNDIVGSVENKMEFMKNNSLKEYEKIHTENNIFFCLLFKFYFT
jgi:hypothetical protein